MRLVKINDEVHVNPEDVSSVNMGDSEVWVYLRSGDPNRDPSMVKRDYGESRYDARDRIVKALEEDRP